MGRLEVIFEIALSWEFLPAHFTGDLIGGIVLLLHVPRQTPGFLVLLRTLSTWESLTLVGINQVLKACNKAIKTEIDSPNYLT